MRTWVRRLAAGTLLLLFVCAGWAHATFLQPWDTLSDDSWICLVGQPELHLHTVNGGDYLVGFDRSKTKDGLEVASGMNALKFRYGGTNTGHLQGGQADTFEVLNLGGKSDLIPFTDLLLVIAIDTAALPADFSLSLSQRGGPGYALGPGDFAWYDPVAAGYTTGRPSGFYSGGAPTGDPGTSPASEPLTYDFDKGMVTIVAFTGFSFNYNDTVPFDYAFLNLPGDAVFSVYGLKTDYSHIYHTNMSVPDVNSATASVSTFQAVAASAFLVPEPGWLSALVLVPVLLRRSARG